MTEEQRARLLKIMEYALARQGEGETYAQDAVIEQSYTLCAIALQLERIADVLEEMYKQPKV